MKSRILKSSDYETLCEWWNWWRFPPVKKSLLPNNGLGGFMVEDEEGNEIAAGFLYFTNSAFALCEYVVSNPDVKDKVKRQEGITFLIDEISKEAKINGVECLFTCVRNKNLEQKYIDAGYQVGTKGSNELIKLL